jgi:hypothetical protein
MRNKGEEHNGYVSYMQIPLLITPEFLFLRRLVTGDMLTTAVYENEVRGKL